MIPIRPSEVTDWLRCPQLWQYKHVEGWQPPAVSWTPERLIGTAVHAGLAAHWQQVHAKDALAETLTDGWPNHAPTEYDLDVYLALGYQVLEKTLTWIRQEMADAKPLMIEQSLGEDGHTTPDLVTRESAGLVVTDWKYHHHVPADRLHYRLEGIDRVHQFWHYIWAVGEYLHEPVKVFRKVAIIGSPKILVRKAEFSPTSEGLAQWVYGAEVIWNEMKGMREYPEFMYQRVDGCFPFGEKWPCPMFEACWTCYGDREKMRQFYTKETQ